MNLENFKNKTSKSLEDHLAAALANNKVNDIYVSSAPKSSGETDKDFAKRLREESFEYQFVGVSTEEGKKYVAFGTSGPIISDEGKFLLIPAQVAGGVWGVHDVLIYPNLAKLLQKKEVFARLSSGCFSGRVLGDKTCDCAEQLVMSRKLCVENGSGIIIEIPEQDGRGWKEHKMANQRLMDELDTDTVTAARLFYEDDNIIDRRKFDEAMIVLRALGFTEKHVFQLGTKNPKKQKVFLDAGFDISETNAIIPANVNNIVKRNIKAKGELWKK